MSSLGIDFSMERSRKDVSYFYRWLGYTWGDHIGEWMKMYGERGDSQVHRVCVIAPRDHSKSTTLRIKLLHSALFENGATSPSPVGCSQRARIWLLEGLRKSGRI